MYFLSFLSVHCNVAVSFMNKCLNKWKVSFQFVCSCASGIVQWMQLLQFVIVDSKVNITVYFMFI